mmetsp:Transcript_43039/g.71538  ORF Transcript_43039/g.71538 Transcript_43039/m.71538 type:complete len:281 (-) Transcript_43039:44-886(-)
MSGLSLNHLQRSAVVVVVRQASFNFHHTCHRLGRRVHGRGVVCVLLTHTTIGLFSFSQTGNRSASLVMPETASDSSVSRRALHAINREYSWWIATTAGCNHLCTTARLSCRREPTGMQRANSSSRTESHWPGILFLFAILRITVSCVMTSSCSLPHFLAQEVLARCSLITRGVVLLMETVCTCVIRRTTGSLVFRLTESSCAVSASMALQQANSPTLRMWTRACRLFSWSSPSSEFRCWTPMGCHCKCSGSMTPEVTYVVFAFARVWRLCQTAVNCINLR